MKNGTYTYFQKYVKDKNKAVTQIIENTLIKTQSMFFYSGLPETLPPCELENILQRRGFAFVTEYNNNLYAFAGGFGGELNEYYKPTKITVANPFFNLSKIYDIDKDGVLFKNDYLCRGLLPIIGKYAVLLTDIGISLNTVSILTRLNMLISASDDKTKESAEIFIEKILNGDLSVIAENAFLKGVNVQSITQNNNVNISQLIELNQYYKANLLNEIGLNSNFNMKRERLSENEILLNSDDLLPFVENMLTERRKAVEKLNKKYGLNVSVDLKCSWKTEKENNDKTNENLETETEEEQTENENTNETENTKETENTEENENTNETKDKENETEKKEEIE